MKQWIVSLAGEERDQLERIVRDGTAAAYKIRRANVLLAMDESPRGGPFTDAEPARAFGVPVRSIESLRWRFVEERLDAAVGREKRERPSIGPMFDGKKEARLIASACGKAPSG